MKLPFSQVSKAFEAWQKLADDSIARAATFYSEIDKAEVKNLERVEGAFEEVAKLTKETFAYQAQLSAEWRKISLETLRRAGAAFSSSTDSSH